MEIMADAVDAREVSHHDIILKSSSPIIFIFFDQNFNIVVIKLCPWSPDVRIMLIEGGPAASV